MAAPDPWGEDLARIFFAPRILLRLAQRTMSEKGTARCLTQVRVLKYGYKFGLSEYNNNLYCTHTSSIRIQKQML